MNRCCCWCSSTHALLCPPTQQLHLGILAYLQYRHIHNFHVLKNIQWKLLPLDNFFCLVVGQRLSCVLFHTISSCICNSSNYLGCLGAWLVQGFFLSCLKKAGISWLFHYISLCITPGNPQPKTSQTGYPQIIHLRCVDLCLSFFPSVCLYISKNCRDWVNSSCCCLLFCINSSGMLLIKKKNYIFKGSFCLFVSLVQVF